MPRYRTKPIVIEAIQYLGDNYVQVRLFCGYISSEGIKSFPIFRRVSSLQEHPDSSIIAEVWDKLHSTWVGVKFGQWIIKGLQGEFYPCDPEIFASKYEVVSEEQTDPFSPKYDAVMKAGRVDSLEDYNRLMQIVEHPTATYVDMPLPLEIEGFNQNGRTE